MNKIVAGAGAAVVTAVLGSFLGAIGTILGAAIGSIITTVATGFFQRSIEHTRAQVTDRTQKIRERTGTRAQTRAPGAAAWQAAAGGRPDGPVDQETVLIDQVRPDGAPAAGRRRFRMSRKSIVFSVIGAVLAFAVAMFLVTGIEWIKGSTITGGGSGTSIGNVVSGKPVEKPRQDTGSTDSTSESTSSSPSTTDSGDSSDRTGTSTSGSGDGSQGSTQRDLLRDGLNRVLPTQQPDNGRLQSAPNGNGNSNNGN